MHVAVESKTEPVTSGETGKSESAELSESAVPAVAGDNTELPVTTDNLVTDLTLSSCEYLPTGEFQQW